MQGQTLTFLMEPGAALMCLELTEGLGNQIPEKLGIFLRLRSSQSSDRAGVGSDRHLS